MANEPLESQPVFAALPLRKLGELATVSTISVLSYLVCDVRTLSSPSSSCLPVRVPVRVPCAVDELRSAARMYEAELQTKHAVSRGLRKVLGVALNPVSPSHVILLSIVRGSDRSVVIPSVQC